MDESVIAVDRGQVLEALSIQAVYLQSWKYAWGFQGEFLYASDKEPEGWSSVYKFLVVMELLA